MENVRLLNGEKLTIRQYNVTLAERIKNEALKFMHGSSQNGIELGEYRLLQMPIFAGLLKQICRTTFTILQLFQLLFIHFDPCLYIWNPKKKPFLFRPVDRNK